MDQLPVEIILAIGDEVEDIKDRFRLIQVCRRWRALLFETAYRFISINGSQIRGLVAAVLVNPRMGASIRDLTVEWWDTWLESYPRSQSNDPLEPGVEELVDAISQSPEERQQWTSDLRGDNQGAWLALLLASVPNLTAFSRHYCNGAKWMTRVVSQAARGEPPFDVRPSLQRLEILNISVDDCKDWLSHSLFIPYFHLPRIQKVVLGGVNEAEEFDPDNRLVVQPALGTAPVTSLHLDTRCNGRNGMADLITSCANLKRFTYQHNNQEIWGDSYRDFRPRAFYAALSTQKHSLEVLHLNDRGDKDTCSVEDGEEEQEDGPMPYDRWFGSLAEFSRLEDLRIRVNNLLNFHPSDCHLPVVLKDILPGSLKWLHLGHCREDHCPVLIANLQEVLVHRDQRFPSLERITVCPAEVVNLQPRSIGQLYLSYPSQYKIPESFKERFESLQETCVRVGVKFDFTLDGSFIICNAHPIEGL